jgi:hypothetical protein
MLQRNSKLMDQPGKQLRSEIVLKAIGSGRENAIRLVAELRFDLNAMILDRTPMHGAAWRTSTGAPVFGSPPMPSIEGRGEQGRGHAQA